MSSRFTIVGRATSELPPPLRAWFLDLAPEPAEALCMKPKRIERFWRVHGARLVEEFATAQPGRRPDAWWHHDAPEPRKRLGGVGVEAHTRLAYARSYYHGVASIFIDCDENDLPYFESEATYLKRLKLFLPGEEQRLPDDAFEPEDIDQARVIRRRSIESLKAEHEARRQKGTLGRHDPRFDK